MITKHSLFMVFAVLCACSQNGNKMANSELRTDDPASALRWPTEKEQLLAQKAAAGDPRSQRDLYDHYILVGKDSKADSLESKLIAADYLPALTRRASMLLAQAQKMNDRDPDKRKVLSEALSLVSRASRLPRPKYLHPVVNGKPITILNLEIEDLRDSIRQEIQRTESPQRGTHTKA